MKKKLCGGLVALLFLWIAVGASADAFGMTQAEIEALTRSLFAMHEESHATIDIIDVAVLGSTGLAQCKYPIERQETILGCVDFGFPQKRIMPKDSAEMNITFREMLRNAKNAAEMSLGVNTLDLERVNQLMKLGSLISFFPGPELWIEGTMASAELIIAPFYLKDIKDEVIDGAMYFMLLLSSDTMSEVWICADQDVVYDLYTRIDFSQAQGTFAVPILRWMEGRGGAGGAAAAQAQPQAEETEPTAAPEPEQTAAPTATPAPSIPQPEGILAATEVGADAPAAAGILLVTSDGSVNMRAEPRFNAAIVAKAKPGDEYENHGQADEDWYETRLTNGKTAYIPADAVTAQP